MDWSGWSEWRENVECGVCVRGVGSECVYYVGCVERVLCNWVWMVYGLESVWRV